MNETGECRNCKTRGYVFSLCHLCASKRDREKVEQERRRILKILGNNASRFTEVDDVRIIVKEIEEATR